MPKRNATTRLITLFGVIFTWLPLLVPLFFSILRFIRSEEIHTDLAIRVWMLLLWLSGSGILIWSAQSARQHQDVMVGCFALSALFLIGSTLLVVIYGLLAGKNGSLPVLILIPGALTEILSFLYYLTSLTLAIEGIKLLHDLFKPSEITNILRPPLSN